jgi:hypothetical protein
MDTETKSMHITPVGGNVFADLGFEPEEAAALQSESKRIISEKQVLTPALKNGDSKLKAGGGRGDSFGNA